MKSEMVQWRDYKHVNKKIFHRRLLTSRFKTFWNWICRIHWLFADWQDWEFQGNPPQLVLFQNTGKSGVKNINDGIHKVWIRHAVVDSL